MSPPHMSDQPRLRHALDDLATGFAPGFATVAVVARAERIRQRRRLRAGLASALCALVAVAAALPRDGVRPGGILVGPGPAPVRPTEAAADTTSTPAPTGRPSASPEPGDRGVAGAPGPYATASGPGRGAASPPTPAETLPVPGTTAEPGTTPPPRCNLVQDARGDAGQLPAESLDVLSADVASDESVVAAVVRVVSLTAGDPQPQGVTWGFGWLLGTRRYELTAFDPPGTPAPAGTLVIEDDGGGNRAEVTDVVVALDPGAGSVHWRVARSHLPDLAEGATRFDDMYAYTARGDAGQDTAADEAQGRTRYRDRAPSCLTP